MLMRKTGIQDYTGVAKTLYTHFAIFYKQIAVKVNSEKICFFILLNYSIFSTAQVPFFFEY